MHMNGAVNFHYGCVMKLFTKVYTNTYLSLKNFAWVDQKANVTIIFHKNAVTLRCEEYFIEWQQCFMEHQSLIKYSYAWNSMDCG